MPRGTHLALLGLVAYWDPHQSVHVFVSCPSGETGGLRGYIFLRLDAHNADARPIRGVDNACMMIGTSTSGKAANIALISASAADSSTDEMCVLSRFSIGGASQILLCACPRIPAVRTPLGVPTSQTAFALTVAFPIDRFRPRSISHVPLRTSVSADETSLSTLEQQKPPLVPPQEQELCRPCARGSQEHGGGGSGAGAARGGDAVRDATTVAQHHDDAIAERRRR